MTALDTLSKSIKSSRGVSSQSFDEAMTFKASGGSISDAMSSFTGGGSSALTDWQQQAKYRQRYSLFRGWLFTAIDAIGQDAGKQPVKIAQMKGRKATKRITGQKSVEKQTQFCKEQSRSLKKTMTTVIHDKAAQQELEIVEDHELIDTMEQPNPLQGRWQMTYMFIANLALTGWGYVIMDMDNDDQLQFYGVPSTWIKPVHKDGWCSHFKLQDPSKPDAQRDEDLIDGRQVGFAYLPDPSDPKKGKAPTSSQIEAVRINDYIQYSRQKFFERGVFPSVIVSIGRDPHPDVPGGVRPRLSAPQKRQIDTMVKKTMSGVGNYANPAIVDGMIEKIERLSMTDNEMGWEKSEASVKQAILSTFRVHPLILGEPINVGGYAQAYIIKQLFCERVNTYLDMLSCVMTKLASAAYDDSSLLVWWEKSTAEDPAEKNKLLLAGRRNGDIGENEFRAELGLPPDEDRNESVISDKTATPIRETLALVMKGEIETDQAFAFFEGLGLPTDLAKRLSDVKNPAPAMPQLVPNQMPQEVDGEEIGSNEVEDVSPEDELKQAIAELRRTDYGNGRRVARMVVNHIEAIK